eukprot:5361036-Pleurochrysis_carterae.AAC.4
MSVDSRTLQPLPVSHASVALSSKLRCAISAAAGRCFDEIPVSGPDVEQNIRVPMATPHESAKLRNGAKS